MNELNLKQWNDEDLSFHKYMKIPFSMCTPERNMTYAELLRFTSDNAGEDFTQRGMSWQFLQENGLVIIVSRISFHINKMPVADQLILLNSWESAAQGPLCTRNFQIVDAETKEELIIAQTLWTIIDLNNHKIVPAKAYPYRPAPTLVTNYEWIKAGKIQIPENMETIGTHKITYSELDANGHTNNSKYINFATDYLPSEFQSKVVKDFRLNYSKEAHLGDEMEIKAFYNSDENKYTIQGIVEGISSFECELYY